MNETDLVRRFIPMAVQTLPVRLFRRQIMLAKSDDGRVMKAGVKGQADIWGFTLEGRHIEIEAKAAGGRLTPDQAAWRDFCLTTGVVYMLAQARPHEPPDTTCLRWVRELNDATRTKRAVNSDKGVADE